MTRNYALGDPCVQLWTFGMFCVSLQTGQSADEDLFFTRSGWLCLTFFKKFVFFVVSKVMQFQCQLSL